MMRHVLLAIVMGVLLFGAATLATAQEITFGGGVVIELARKITTEAKRSSRLPSAYRVPMANGHNMDLSAANAFELLVRMMVNMRQYNQFATEVPLLLHDLKGPGVDQAIEPKRAGLPYAVPAMDITSYAAAWLATAEAPGHKMLRQMKFETGYTLTAAQFTIAIAGLIAAAADASEKKLPFPEAVVIPLAYSPSSWDDTRNPIEIVPPVIIPPIEVFICLNDTMLTMVGPPMPPLCGRCRVTILAKGPVDTVKVRIDSGHEETFKGEGLNTFIFSTLDYSDGAHSITVEVIDTEGKNHLYINDFSIMNGRKGTFNPMQRDEVTVEASPAKP